MKIIHLSLLLLFACSFSACSHTNSNRENTVVSTALCVTEDLDKPVKKLPPYSVRFRYQYKHMYFNCSIKDMPLNLVLDLCGGSSFIAKETALKLHTTQKIPISSDTAFLTGKIPLLFGTNDTANAAHSYTFYNLSIDKNDYFAFKNGIDGFINPVKQFDEKRMFFIDYHEQYITVFFDDAEKDSIRETLTNQKLQKLPLKRGGSFFKPYSIFPVEINDHKLNLKLYLDTGLNSDIYFFTDTSSILKDIPLAERGVIYSTRDTTTAFFSDITFFNSRIDSCRITLLTDNDGQSQRADRDVDGLVGNSVLENFLVWIDFEKNCLYLKEKIYNRKIDASQRNSLGISYVNRNQNLFVTELYVGKRADKAGVKPGDLIVAVNEKPVLAFDSNDLHSLFNANDAITLDIERNGEIIKINIQCVK